MAFVETWIRTSTRVLPGVARCPPSTDFFPNPEQEEKHQNGRKNQQKYFKGT
jgi:hypothetical protein